jgi:ferredoxin
MGKNSDAAGKIDRKPIAADNYSARRLPNLAPGRAARFRSDAVAAEHKKQEARRSIYVRIMVDLIRCQSYGQCIYAAPSVFRFNGELSLEFDYAPDDVLRDQVERAVAACPVQAIRIGLPDRPTQQASRPAAEDCS